MADLIDGRRLEFVGGNSNKFWEWRLYEDVVLEQFGKRLNDGAYSLVFTWGRRGTTGQSMVERFTDKRLALWKAAAREKLKRSHGYEVVRDWPPTPRQWLKEPVARSRVTPPPKKPPPEPPKPETPARTVRLIKLRD